MHLRLVFPSIFLLVIGFGCATALAEGPAATSTAEQAGARAMPRASVPARDFETRSPFVVPAAYRGFASNRVGDTRVFQGMAVLQRYLVENQIVAYPIGEFTAGALPGDPAGFRAILERHAAEIGADFVVICTDPAELGANFVGRQKHCFGALAYKRVRVRLGIVYDSEASKNGVTRVVGFAPGSKASVSGLKVGDTVVKVDGTTLSGDAFRARVLSWKAGQKVEVEIVREGRSRKVQVELTPAG